MTKRDPRLDDRYPSATIRAAKRGQLAPSDPAFRALTPDPWQQHLAPNSATK